MTVKTVAMWLCLTTGASLQVPRPSRETPRGSHDVVAQGCLDGSWLRHARLETGGSTEDFRLRLPKSLRKALKEFQGHEITIAGRMDADDRTMDGGKTAKIDAKTKISVGAREDRTSSVPPAPRQIEVTDFSEIARTCVR